MAEALIYRVNSALSFSLHLQACSCSMIPCHHMMKC